MLAACGGGSVAPGQRPSNAPPTAINRPSTVSTQPGPFSGPLSIPPPPRPSGPILPSAPPVPQPAPSIVPSAPAIPPAAAPGPRLTQPAAPKLARVALIAPLTGRAPAVGRDLLDAAQLALFDIADERFELIVKDDGGTPEGATRAATQALAEGAQLLLGPLFRESVVAVAPVARARNVQVVAFSNDRSVAGDGVFILGFTPDGQIERVVRHAAGVGIKGFAAIVPDNAFGTAVMSSLDRAATQTGGQLTRRQTLADGADIAGDMRRAMMRILEQGPGGRSFQALVLPEGGPRLKAAAQQLVASGVQSSELRILGTREWQEPDSCREAALQGAWFASSPPETVDAFLQRFAATYRRTPPRLATLAYDAVALAAVLARDPKGPDFSAETIGSPNGFAGTAGIFRFGPDGVAQRGLAVFEALRTGCVIVSPAPDSFEDATN